MSDHTHNTDPDNILKQHGLRKTAMRIRVLELFQGEDAALSHPLIEQTLGDVDRVTLYRTLRTFEQKGIIHRAIDGTETMKYALCGHQCSEDAHADQHAHFHCNGCGQTFCVDHLEVPSIQVPVGFQVETAHLVVKGRCSACVR